MAQKLAKSLKTGLFVGRVRLTPEQGSVHDEVMIEGEGFPADSVLDIIWESYDARWEIEQLDGQDWNEFLGISYETRLDILAQVKTDQQGMFKASLQIPEDYGGMHDVYVVLNMQKLNKAGFRLQVSAELTPSGGPVGSEIEVLVKGLNPAHPFEGWYQLFYDNHFVGCITAVTTKGTAKVAVPAVGEPGRHIIGIELATYGTPFIQVDVSSYSYVKTFHLPFEVMPGEATLPPPVQEQILLEKSGIAPAQKLTGPHLWTDFIEIPSQSAFTLFGQGFSPRQEIELRWVDIAGDRVSEVQPGRFGTGFQELPRVVGKVITDDQGAFQLKIVPESVQGGAHPVEAWSDGKLLSRTYVTVSRRAHPLRPKGGPVGTPITVEVDGVGWTEHENEVAFTYDNSYVGYACGADLMGKILPKIYATGRPGWHFIDLYPTIRNSPEFLDGRDKPAFYRRPILTWMDHPHGFHFRYGFWLENTLENS
jgi:hypothetical protein